MPSDDLRQRAALRVSEIQQRIHHMPVLLGLDGFIDEIVRLVDKRFSTSEYALIPTISALAERISRAAGKSTNIELIVQKVKLGGNGPIMANAMCAFGFEVTYIGNLGFPEIHPVFEDFARKAKVYSIAEAGHTDALEFEDGKIMLGKYESLRDVHYGNILRHVGEERFRTLWDQARFYALVNWTMIEGMTDFWQQLLAHHCRPDADKIIFFDLADPEKRTPEDIREALETISRFADFYHVILGCNEKESMELSAILGIEVGGNDMDAIRKRAEAMRKAMNIQTVVIHPVKFAVAASLEDSAAVHGPYIEKPLISTGGGDHFNAGFCLGMIAGFDLETALLCGVGTSGYYVRHAEPPTLEQLADFLRQWGTSAAG